MYAWVVIIATMACSPPEPVLSGIPESPILKQAPSLDEKKPKTPAPYAKPEDVYVDARHFGGKRFEIVRDQVIDQMGQRQGQRVLSASQGKEIQYIRGRIRVKDGVIYMIQIDLPRAMLRREALQSTGFPAFTGGAIRFSGEYRINNQWDFRRIRMKREYRDAEMVNQIEAWRWNPRER